MKSPKSDSIEKSEDLNSNNKKSEESSKKEKAKEIYFIVLYKKKAIEKKNDFIFSKNEFKIENIYNKWKEEKRDQLIYQKVFKLYNNVDKMGKKKEIKIEFEIGSHKYAISFNVENRIFYYDIELTEEIKYLSLFAKKTVDQNFLNYFQKLEVFSEALKKNKEEDKIDKLYEETIKLYSKKKGFYLLISLFINIYEKQSLCRKLIEEFYQINKEKKNEKYMDRNKSLNDYVSIFSTISSNADDITKKYNYNPIHFYAIIFSYLNYYDYENFKK